MQNTGDFYLHNVRLATRSHVEERAWLRVVNGVIRELGSGGVPTAVATSGSNVVDGCGHWLAPGFIDIHVHGGNGADVMDGTVKALQTIAQYHAGHGTTGWLPTTVTAAPDGLQTVVETVAKLQQGEQVGAHALGVHLEGPFLSVKRIGAQNPQFLLEPTVAMCERVTSAAPGVVKKMTIAPEVPGALDVIRWLHQNGIIPSLGHTDATAEEAQHALSLGRSHGTHLFNGMRGLHHREPGVLGALLSDNRAVCEVIADGIHVHPEVIQLIVGLKGPERVVLITDAMAAAGQPDGRYSLGGLDVTVEDGIPYLVEGHNLAGSTLTMDRAVRNMVNRVGVTLADAVAMASANPARELGLAHRKGDIAIGMDADFVLLDESLSVVRTFAEGQEVYSRS